MQEPLATLLVCREVKCSKPVTFRRVRRGIRIEGCAHVELSSISLLYGVGPWETTWNPSHGRLPLTT